MVCIDISANSEADVNLTIDSKVSMKEQVSGLLASSRKASQGYDSIICVSGGFGVSSVKDADIFEKYEQMDKMNF